VFAAQAEWMTQDNLPQNYHALPSVKRRQYIRSHTNFCILTPQSPSNNATITQEKAEELLQHTSTERCDWDIEVLSKLINHSKNDDLNNRSINHYRLTNVAELNCTHSDKQTIDKDTSTGVIVVYSGGRLPASNPILSLLKSRSMFASEDLEHLLLTENSAMTSKLEGLKVALSLLLPVPFVWFECPISSWEMLNFGQKDDCFLLNYVMKSVHRMYPNKKILLMGASLGALRLLNWLRYSKGRNIQESLVGLTMWSPILSHEHYIQLQTESSSSRTWLSKITKLLLRNYQAKDETSYSFLCNYDQPLSVPILFTHRNHAADLEVLKTLKQHFKFASDQIIESSVMEIPLYESIRFRQRLFQFLV
jgi:hypothetical protein